MATTTVVVGDYHDSTALAQRLVVWAQHDKRIRTTHTGDGRLAFVVPDDLVADILEYGGSGTIDLGGTGPGAEIDTSVGGTVAPTFLDVTGIDPNSYNHEKDAPTDLAVTPLLGLDGEPIPGAYLITWTYEERHSHFVIRYRTQAEEDAPENPWRVSHYPPYARQARVYGVTGTIEVNLQAVVREGFYVPIASALATGTATPAAVNAVGDTDSVRTGDDGTPPAPSTPELRAAAPVGPAAPDSAPTTETAAKKAATSVASATRKKVSAPVKSSTTDQK